MSNAYEQPKSLSDLLSQRDAELATLRATLQVAKEALENLRANSLRAINFKMSPSEQQRFIDSLSVKSESSDFVSLLGVGSKQAI